MTSFASDPLTAANCYRLVNLTHPQTQSSIRHLSVSNFKSDSTLHILAKHIKYENHMYDKFKK